MEIFVAIVISLIVLICFFVLCSNVAAIKGLLMKISETDGKKIDEIKSEIEKLNMSIRAIERNTNKKE